MITPRHSYDRDDEEGDDQEAVGNQLVHSRAWKKSPGSASSPATAGSGSGSPSYLDQTIDFMAISDSCFDPIHYHSFQAVSFLLPLRSCCGCGQRLNSMMFGTSAGGRSSSSVGVGRNGGGGGGDTYNPGNLVVQCVACGKFAHRSCGLRRDLEWKEVCPVNSQKLKQQHYEEDSDAYHQGSVDEDEHVHALLEGMGSRRGRVGNTRNGSQVPLSFDRVVVVKQSSSPAPKPSSTTSSPEAKNEIVSISESPRNDEALMSSSSTSTKTSSFSFLSPSRLLPSSRSKEEEEIKYPTSNTALKVDVGDSQYDDINGTVMDSLSQTSPPSLPSLPGGSHTKTSHFSFLSPARPLPSTKIKEEGTQDVEPGGDETAEKMDVTNSQNETGRLESISSSLSLGATAPPAMAAASKTSHLSFLSPARLLPSSISKDEHHVEPGSDAAKNKNVPDSHDENGTGQLPSPATTTRTTLPDPATKTSKFSFLSPSRLLSSNKCTEQPKHVEAESDPVETTELPVSPNSNDTEESPLATTSVTTTLLLLPEPAPVTSTFSFLYPSRLPTSSRGKELPHHLETGGDAIEMTTDVQVLLSEKGTAESLSLAIPPAPPPAPTSTTSSLSFLSPARRASTSKSREDMDAVNATVKDTVGGNSQDDNSTVHDDSGTASKVRFPLFSAARILGTSSKEEGNNAHHVASNTSDESTPNAGPPTSIFRRINHTDHTGDAKTPSQATLQPLEWTKDGPPVHWAAANSLGGTGDLSKQEQLVEETETNGLVSRDDKADVKEALHFSSHPFASVSRALQENVVAHFHLIMSTETNGGSEDLRNEVSLDCEAQTKENELLSETQLDTKSRENTESKIPKSSGSSEENKILEKTPSAVSEAPAEAEVEALLTEVDPKEDPIDERTATHRRLGLATVAGGVAGGMVGLVFAGPMGGVIGAKCGQTAGILGVLLEGSISIGVLASGIAAGKYTAEQLQDRLEEKRVLAFGEDGTHRQVILVRPNIRTDPVWDALYAKARQAHRRTTSKGLSFGLLRDKEAEAKRERYEREADIVRTGEEEIPTADKVLLLVSRILNDKSSLPGYVYRHLLEAFRIRCRERGSLDAIVRANRSGETLEKDDSDETKEGDGPVALHLARRRDAHAVIKCVTAALQEVRPGFGSCASMTELTATAVESLVFGEVYTLVIEEIEAECDDTDNCLLEKIADFERRQSINEDYKSYVSEQALEALHRLPQAHSAVDKLRYCVQFLELISDFFSTSVMKKSSAMGADSLLKMVCQHVLLAKVFGINAQIAFLGEFARDEQLLRGREGYALVTFQASLHFLNVSNDFENDIFGQHDED
jgi:hypothetical protein